MKEKDKETNMKIEELEQKLNKKHSDLLAHLDKWTADICNLVNKGNSAPTYASMTSVRLPSGSQAANQMPGCQFAVPQPTHLSVSRDARSRLNSQSKKRKNSDGSASFSTPATAQPHSDMHRSKNDDRCKKGIVGTSDSNVTGRKMKSPCFNFFFFPFSFFLNRYRSQAYDGDDGPHCVCCPI